MFQITRRRPAIALLTAAFLISGCSEPTPESRAQAEAAFPEPDQNIFTADIPKETPPAVKEAMRKVREGAADLADGATEKGAELLDQAREAIHEATAKKE
ncbi:MAG: hypothetical protein H6926_03250 [Chromatiales bacterium]|nr:hypothetical protein [Gammaproteobacteria bacterium]MCP5352191.1 hypothetical protein [Chromatiales bacterium]